VVGVVAGGRARRTRLPDVHMEPSTLRVAGRRLRFAISDNQDAFGPDGPGTPPIWAVNIHGYFAAGGMYARESARLAARFGWRVVNPSLPGFGGSDPLDWHEVSMEALSEQIELLLDHVDAGPVVLLGHSMGGAVAVRFATDKPKRTLGILYRDGVATPAWRQRRGVIQSLLTPIVPDSAPIADMMAAVILDSPDLLIGRIISTFRSVMPDFRRNLRTLDRTVLVGSMLMTVDLRPEIRDLVAQDMPILSEWGCFDRVATSACAAEFAECARTTTVWVPGGHSWMLARPSGQADVLAYLPAGQAFIWAVTDRWRRLTGVQRGLRAVN